MRTFISGLMVCVMVISPVTARDKRPSKEARRLEQLRASLESKSPGTYCEAVFTFRPNGFFPYCSPISYPSLQHSFTLTYAIKFQKSELVNMRQVGDRMISAKATEVEKKLIDEGGEVNGEGCLGERPSSCIAYLSNRFLLTTPADIPFYDWIILAKFDPDEGRRRNLNLQIVLPHTDTRSSVMDFGFSDSSPRFDIVEIDAYVVEGKIESLSFSGRYPILSENPYDYKNSGFADFITTVFPNCRSENEETFYRNFWSAIVKPAQFSESDGKWRFTSSGITKTYTRSSDGNFCGLKVSSYSSYGRTINEEGMNLSTSSKKITFWRPN